jgi:hypothetical protein
MPDDVLGFKLPDHMLHTLPVQGYMENFSRGIAVCRGIKSNYVEMGSPEFPDEFAPPKSVALPSMYQ